MYDTTQTAVQVQVRAVHLHARPFRCRMPLPHVGISRRRESRGATPIPPLIVVFVLAPLILCCASMQDFGEFDPSTKTFKNPGRFGTLPGRIAGIDDMWKTLQPMIEKYNWKGRGGVKVSCQQAFTKLSPSCHTSCCQPLVKSGLVGLTLLTPRGKS